MLRCARCRTENPDQARFCRACGTRLAAEAPGEAYQPQMLTPEERGRRLLEDGFRLSEEGRLQAAIQACQQAIALNPSSTSAHSLLGTLFERVGDRDGAIREYEQVLTLSPGSTVERRRLNELMGVPSAPQPVTVSPRAARMAVTGGFVVVALVLVGAIVFTTQQPSSPPRERAARAPAQAARPERAAVSTPAAPPRLLTLGRPVAARAPAPRRVAAPARPARRATEYGVGQWIGPGTFLLQSGGRERFAGLGSWGGGAQRVYISPPLDGAILVRRAGAPTVSTPGWRQPYGMAQLMGGSSPRLARNYYFQGEYRRAIETYRGYLNEYPDAGAEPREELAWVYTEAGDYQSARQEYRVALDQYEADLDRGHNVEAARHGVRSCESAIKALESE